MSFLRSPQSLTGVSAWGRINLISEVQPVPTQALFKSVPNRFVTALPPSCHSNDLGYSYVFVRRKAVLDRKPY
ncbi:MAG: hypothetical protein N6V49_11310 [Serratia symbiotica]|nr:hypothetical protein [Serratia symbiotica]